MAKIFGVKMFLSIFALPYGKGTQGDVAQLVEQRTENPCVGGSIPSITTERPVAILVFFFGLGFEK